MLSTKSRGGGTDIPGVEMGINALSRADVCARAVRNLGLDSEAFNITSPEAIAASLRRAAGVYCPCSPTTLLRAVLRPLDGLIEDMVAVEEAAENVLEAMIAYGDLLESRGVASEKGEGGGNLLYAAPPAFVMRDSGAALVIGIVPQRLSPLTKDLDARVGYVNHSRRLPPEIEDLRSRLSELGLIEISTTTWMKAPSTERPEAHLARLNKYLAAAPPSIEVPGLKLIDPEKPVRYYRRRWIEKVKGAGCYVGRRPQAYGADLWCYVQLENGNPTRFLDLPIQKSRVRGCDEAWHLQAAIDAVRGEPQCYHVRRDSENSVLLDFFSPVPMWARRRWDALGEPISSRGSLFSYRFKASEIEEELKFARENLWLAETTGQ